MWYTYDTVQNGSTVSQQYSLCHNMNCTVWYRYIITVGYPIENISQYHYTAFYYNILFGKSFVSYLAMEQCRYRYRSNRSPTFQQAENNFVSIYLYIYTNRIQCTIRKTINNYNIYRAIMNTNIYRYNY